MESLKDIRVSKGLTQEDVARKMQMTRQTYAKIEADSGRLTQNEAKELASILGVSVDAIFFA